MLNSLRVLLLPGLILIAPSLVLHAQVDVIEEVEPNDSIQTAQLLKEGVAVVGGVTGADAACSRPADRYDVYGIPFNRAGTLELTIHPTSGPGNLEIEVFSYPEETYPSLSFSFIDSPDTLRVRCVQDDTLFLRVSVSRSLDCIDYWLSWEGLDSPVMEDNLEPDDWISRAHRVPFGSVLRGRVGYGRPARSSDPVDFYWLTDVPEGDITFYFQGDSFSSVRLNMFGPFFDVTLGGVADSATYECITGIDSLLVGISTPSGCVSYSLRAVATPTPESTIIPDVELNSSIATAIQKSLPFALEGRLGEIRYGVNSRRDSVDMYRVELAEGDTMRGYIRFHHLNSARLVLRGAGGLPVLSWSQHGLKNPSDTIPVEWFNAEPGPMFISVESRDNDCGFYEGFFSIGGVSSVHAPGDPDRPSLSALRGIMELHGLDAGIMVTVELYDVRGERVAERRGDDLRSLNLPPGIYLYRILTDGNLIAEGRIRN